MSMSPFGRSMLAGIILGCAGALCVGTVLMVDHYAKLYGNAGLDAAAVKRIRTLLPPEAEVPGMRLKCSLVSDPRIGSGMRLYTADVKGTPAGYVMTYETSLGYASPLVLIAGFDTERRIHRVDIEQSNETPGIGDRVDRRHGSFLDQLNGRAYSPKGFDVVKFGGEFDSITGATVTSRAVIRATGTALEVMQQLNIPALPPCDSE